jgi:hypothetical protein
LNTKSPDEPGDGYIETEFGNVSGRRAYPQALIVADLIDDGATGTDRLRSFLDLAFHEAAEVTRRPAVRRDDDRAQRLELIARRRRIHRLKGGGVQLACANRTTAT